MRCVLIKKIWLYKTVNQRSKELINFKIGTRDTRHFENLSKKTSHIDPKKYATDRYVSYNLIDPAKRIIGKAYYFTVERMNRLLRHYLACFAQKTYCQPKAHYIFESSVLLFMKLNLLSSIRF